MALLIDAIIAKDLETMVKDNVRKSLPIVSTDGKIQKFVESVANATRKDKMFALRIWSHGWTHYGSGGDYPDGNVDFGGGNLRKDTFETFRPQLVLLAPCFVPGSRVELRGCAAAKGSGKQMMLALAATLGAEIHGSDKSQHLITMWQPPVYRATPDGKWGITPGIEVGEGR